MTGGMAGNSGDGVGLSCKDFFFVNKKEAKKTLIYGGVGGGVARANFNAPLGWCHRTWIASPGFRRGRNDVVGFEFRGLDRAR